MKVYILRRIQAWGRKGVRSLKEAWDQQEWLWRRVRDGANLVSPASLVLCLALLIYDLGFLPFQNNDLLLGYWIQILVGIALVAMGVRYVLDLFAPMKTWVRILGLLRLAFLFFLGFYLLPYKYGITDLGSGEFIIVKVLLYLSLTLVMVTEVSSFVQSLPIRSWSAPTLLAVSFAGLCVLGAFLLMLPNATHRGISPLEALFTATSAVCVTGLMVVDLATEFTRFGQIIILLLIQLGGLGMMTFAGLIAYSVAGNTSLKAQLAFKDLVNSQQMSQVLQFLSQVVLVTLIFEALGGVLIYWSIEDLAFPTPLEKFFFVVFHTISAFCNAGFSTFSSGLYDPLLRHHYGLHMSLALLVILGGLGFPVIFHIYRFGKVKFYNLWQYIQGNPNRAHFPGLRLVNARLSVQVTVLLLVLGTLVFLVFEAQGALRPHEGAGKWVSAFFASVSARTAGFATINVSALSLPTLMVYLLLMYIGASPGSTGGGIKTTTAGLAILNLMAVLKGRDRLQYARSEISPASVRRAFAIILLSMICIGFFSFLIALEDANKGLVAIVFEVFGAFSTAGMSLGITTDLSDFSKIVLMMAMYVGRIGMITVLLALIPQSKPDYLRYPQEEINF